jgi:hypothetical protein
MLGIFRSRATKMREAALGLLVSRFANTDQIAPGAKLG